MSAVASGVIVLSVVIQVLFVFFMTQHNWYTENVGLLFNLAVPREINSGLLTVTMNTQTRFLFQSWLQKKANDRDNRGLWKLFEYKAPKTIWLKSFVDEWCFYGRATGGLIGDTCTGPTFMFWMFGVCFACLCINVICLFGAACLVGHYWFSVPKKKSRTTAVTLVCTGTAFAFMGLIIFFIGSMVGGMHFLFDVFGITYSSSNTAPTLAGGTYGMACMVFLLQCALLGVVCKALKHPEENIWEEGDDSNYYTFHAAEEGLGYPVQPNVFGQPAPIYGPAFATEVVYTSPPVTEVVYTTPPEYGPGFLRQRSQH